VGLYRRADVVALPVTRAEGMVDGAAITGSALVIPISR
jgi:hypothetical protein